MKKREKRKGDGGQPANEARRDSDRLLLAKALPELRLDDYLQPPTSRHSSLALCSTPAASPISSHRPLSWSSAIDYLSIATVRHVSLLRLRVPAARLRQTPTSYRPSCSRLLPATEGSR